MRKTSLIVFLVILYIFAFALSASAQMVIDYDEALQLAMERNRLLQLLKSDNEYANLQVKEAYSGAMPVISAIGSYSHNFIIPVMASDFEMNGEKMSFKMALARENNYYGSVELQQPLWIAGKIGIAIKIAKLYREIAETSVRKGEKDLRMQVTQAFYGYLMVQEYRALSEQAEEQIKSHLKNAKAMYEQGVVSEYDYIRAETELANFHPQVTAAQEACKIAEEGLRILLGLTPDEKFTVQGELKASHPQDVEIESAVAFALDNRTEVRQLGLQKQMLDKLVVIEQRNLYWPSFFFSASYTKQAQEDNFDWGNYFWGEGLSAGVSVSIPLFDGFKAHSRVQMAKIELRKNNINQQLLRDGLRIQIKTAASKLYEAKDKLDASLKAVETADRGYAIAEVRYREGLSTQVELLDARLAQTQAKTAELSARYDLIAAQSELENAMGK